MSKNILSHMFFSNFRILISRLLSAFKKVISERLEKFELEIEKVSPEQPELYENLLR